MRLFGNSIRNWNLRRRRQPAPKQPRVVFVSHEASRTGAPRIILQLLNQFADKCDIACETILLKGGHIAKEFTENSVVDCFGLTNKNPDQVRKRTHSFVNRYGDSRPTVALCNSMESRWVTKSLNELGIPCVSLVHELPSGYGKSEFELVYSVSEKVIFPVEYVRNAVSSVVKLPADKTEVLPQGLLTPDFGQNIAADYARQSIRQELSLPQDAFIVLGCGTLDLRKGIDHFANIARHTLESVSDLANKPIHFVWVGDGPRWPHSLHHYVKIDLQKSTAQHHVHFIGGRDNVEPYFVGSDCFLMCSRVDPFPCVIHEAMTTGLPVIAFQNAGGAPEAIADGAGFVVPYADYGQVANLLRLLRDQPNVASSVREKSKQRVNDLYTFDNYADSLIDMCEQVSGQSLRSKDTQQDQWNGLRVHRAA